LSDKVNAERLIEREKKIEIELMRSMGFLCLPFQLVRAKSETKPSGNYQGEHRHAAESRGEREDRQNDAKSSTCWKSFETNSIRLGLPRLRWREPNVRVKRVLAWHCHTQSPGAFVDDSSKVVCEFLEFRTLVIDSARKLQIMSLKYTAVAALALVAASQADVVIKDCSSA
jgi:hypothetical protein